MVTAYEIGEFVGENLLILVAFLIGLYFANRSRKENKKNMEEEK